MGASERRNEILRTLCRRRHETIGALASEFGVSARTIQRDIETLSRTEPIFTQSGKYGGGVYVMDGYSLDRMYMTDAEIAVLEKIYIAAANNTYVLTFDEKKILHSLISQYSKPKIKNERNLS